MRSVYLAATTVAALLMSSCVSTVYLARERTADGSYFAQQVDASNRGDPDAPTTAEDSGWWFGDMVTGTPSIKVDLSEQEAYYYKGGDLVGVAPISSGKVGYTTVTGSFKIIEKDIDHRSTLYGDFVDGNGRPFQQGVDVRKDPLPQGATFDGAEMNYFMRITGAIGMHEGYLPGYPASHGCIRLPRKMAMVFFESTPLGTPVEIVR